MPTEVKNPVPEISPRTIEEYLFDHGFLSPEAVSEVVSKVENTGVFSAVEVQFLKDILINTLNHTLEQLEFLEHQPDFWEKYILMAILKRPLAAFSPRGRHWPEPNKDDDGWKTVYLSIEDQQSALVLAAYYENILWDLEHEKELSEKVNSEK